MYVYIYTHVCIHDWYYFLNTYIHMYVFINKNILVLLYKYIETHVRLQKVIFWIQIYAEAFTYTSTYRHIHVIYTCTSSGGNGVIRFRNDVFCISYTDLASVKISVRRHVRIHSEDSVERESLKTH